MEMEALAQCDPGMQFRSEYDLDDDLINGYAHNLSGQHAKDILNSISDSGIGIVPEDYDSDEWENGFYKRARKAPGRSQSCRASMRKRGARVGASFRSDRPYKYDIAADTPHGSISPRSDEEDISIDSNHLGVIENGIRLSSQKSLRSSSSSLHRRVRFNYFAFCVCSTLIFFQVLTPDMTLGHNENIFKVVLCGDAGVGKSSFIYRLCRDKFKRHTTSTLGKFSHDIKFQVACVKMSVP